MTDKKFEFKKFITPPFRLSFPCLDEPKLGPDGTGKLKWSLRMVFPKTMSEADQKLFEALSVGCRQAAIDFWGQGNIPDNLKKPKKDGDSSKYENEKGNWIMNARTDQSPTVCDEKRNEMKDPQAIKKKFYAGSWCRASVLVGATKKAGNPAVYLILRGVQWLKDDKPYGNATNALDDFSPVVYTDTADFATDGDGF